MPKRDTEITTLLDAEVGTKLEASVSTIYVIGYKSLLPIGFDMLDGRKVLISRYLTTAQNV